MKENNTLSTEPYKGMRDFYPDDMAIQNYIFQKMSDVAESFGYAEYSAPILEDTALYRAKSGEEIVNEQTYSFTDRGGRDVTLRPEMTPTVARLVAQKRKELVFPLRWYSIPNLFRYERPQKGRLREHFQLNVDMFGVDNIFADEEIIQISSEIMKSFGADSSKFEIKVNDRRIINFLLNNVLNLDSESAYKLSKLIDRKNKISAEEFKSEAQELVGGNIDSLIQILNVSSISELPGEFQSVEAVSEMQKLISDLKEAGISNVVFDPSLMRGFDYYTKMIFEVFDKDPANRRSLFGGGRYDDLVSLFGVEKVPGVGFGMGDVTIRDYLENYNLIPAEAKSSVDLYVCNMGLEYIKPAEQLADNLRKSGVRVAVDLTDRKLASQVKTADKQGARFVLCIGEDEVKSNSYKLKDLRNNIEVSVELGQIAGHTKA
jgi:histidyl-tRNA synthetase